MSPAERAELDWLLESGVLGRSANALRVLRYICEESAAGRADRVKEYTIAVEALGRRPDFDPQHDTIVRVTALQGALRKRLQEVYSNGRRRDPCRSSGHSFWRLRSPFCFGGFQATAEAFEVPPADASVDLDCACCRDCGMAEALGGVFSRRLQAKLVDDPDARGCVPGFFGDCGNKAGQCRTQRDLAFALGRSFDCFAGSGSCAARSGAKSLHRSRRTIVAPCKTVREGQPLRQ